MKTRMTGFQKPLASDPAKAQPVGIAMIKTTSEGMIYCSCGGWQFIHRRVKVREDRAQAHLDNKHGGAGVWL